MLNSQAFGCHSARASREVWRAEVSEPPPNKSLKLTEARHRFSRSPALRLRSLTLALGRDTKLPPGGREDTLESMVVRGGQLSVWPVGARLMGVAARRLRRRQRYMDGCKRPRVFPWLRRRCSRTSLGPAPAAGAKLRTVSLRPKATARTRSASPEPRKPTPPACSYACALHWEAGLWMRRTRRSRWRSACRLRLTLHGWMRRLTRRDADVDEPRPSRPNCK